MNSASLGARITEDVDKVAMPGLGTCRGTTGLLSAPESGGGKGGALGSTNYSNDLTNSRSEDTVDRKSPLFEPV